jgi:hypothetical protein
VFIEKYGKTYSDLNHYEERLAIFADNLREIEHHNLQGHSWTKAVNKFADLSRNGYKLAA